MSAAVSLFVTFKMLKELEKLNIFVKNEKL